MTWCHSQRLKAKTTRPKLMFLVLCFIVKDTLSNGHHYLGTLFWEVPRSVLGGPPCIRLYALWTIPLGEATENPKTTDDGGALF